MSEFLPVGLAWLMFLVACVGAPPPVEEPLPLPEPFDVQGHRGARGLLPENTLEAFHLALELGVSTLELDLGVTADGVVVVSHDPRINGSICRSSTGGQVASPGPLLRDLTLAQVQSFDCGSLNPSRRRFPEPPRRNIPGARIPTLAEVFALARDFGDDGVQFNIETKIDPTRDLTVPADVFVDAVLAVVQEFELEERVLIQSFDWRTLEASRDRAPQVRTVALLKPETLRGRRGRPSPWLNGLDFDGAGGTALGLLRELQRHGDYVDVFSPQWRLIDPRSGNYLGSSVAELQAAGFPVIPWTVNSDAELERILDLGVDGAITDFPDRLLERVRRRGGTVL